MNEVDRFDISFRPNGRGKAQCAPNPNYPDGKNMDITKGELGCLIELPYPAPECGIWVVKCKACGLKVGITAAGRHDDPRDVRVPCKKIEGVMQ